jgi:hypothetical protein
MGELDAVAYAQGRDPIDWAESLVKAQIQVRDEIVIARREDPCTYPGYLLALDDAAVARRILGRLLDAGWTPPQVPR